jgi:juvenile hormone acid methyltransferase
MNDPKLYDKVCHELSAREVTEVLSVYIKRMSWKTGERVLDLGCGPGGVTTKVLLPRLPADFGLLVGADNSTDALQYASNTYAHPKLKFTQFDVVKDIDKTSQLQPSSFHKIFCFFCLHWISDHRYYLAIKLEFHS